MGSPTLGILLEIFLQEIEGKHFENWKLKLNIIMISQYVHDILIINNNDKYNEESIVQELNLLYYKIEFTYEKETKK